ncbi:MAG: isocitrate lyase/phosphoenolpyruvate mutase family protein [Actinomycetota bacterium]|nr:isocitrate lyase/phosphoenolpyruvate mutase family protein [Actinomycetota bacterium]
MTADLVAKAQALRALHVPGDPLVLPNAWDAASAKVVVDAGFPAIATTSLGVAESLGYGDGHKTPPDEMFAAIARIARVVSVPVTADIERGYELEPKEIVKRLVEAGAVGCNLEDTEPRTKELIDIDEQADFLRGVRSAASDAAVPIVINARIDVHLREVGGEASRTPAAIERAMRYLEAGADCVYPAFLTDVDEVRKIVDAVQGAVNVTLLPGTSLASFTSAGVARISLGGGLQKASTAWLSSMVGKIASGQDPYAR